MLREYGVEGNMVLRGIRCFGEYGVEGNVMLRGIWC